MVDKLFLVPKVKPIFKVCILENNTINQFLKEASFQLPRYLN